MRIIPAEIKALFFDLNGTLIRDRNIHRRAFADLFSEYGVELSDSEYEERITNRLNREIWRTVFGDGMSEADMAALSAVKERRYLALLERQKYLAPGGARLVKAAREAGKKCGLVTSASQGVVERILPLIGLRAQDFDVLVCGSDVSRGKPDPECYRLAFARAQVSAECAAVFEDSPQGITAAARAGAGMVLGVLPEYGEEELARCGATAFIGSFEEVSLGTGS